MHFFRLPRRRSIQLRVCTALALAIGLLSLCLYLLAAAPTVVADQGRLSSQPSDPLRVPGVEGSAFQAPPSPVSANGETLFTRDDGLADNSVTALWHDDSGLWVGTMAGLSRYILRGGEAGLNWQTFTQDDGMAADAVSDLWSDDSGGLWVAHPDRSISFFNGDTWTTFENLTETLGQAYKQIIDTHAASPLWALEEGGRVWTLAEGTVGYYVGSVWRPYGEDAGIPQGNLIAVWTGDGAWVASETGQIGHFDGANWTTFRNAFDAIQSQYEIIVGSGPGAGPLWLVDQEGAVWVRNAFNQRNPQPDVRRFFEGVWTNYGTRDGMADGFVAELRLDRYGRIWARHESDANGQGGGLSLFSGDQPALGAGVNSWTAITPASSSNVTDFAAEGTDGVWIASFYQSSAGGVPVGGLSFVALNSWQRFSSESLGGAAVRDTWLDEDNVLWLGLGSDRLRGLEGGLWRYRPPQGIRPARWTPVSGLLDNDVRDLWGDGSGYLWVATPGGVDRITLTNRKIVSYTQPSRPDRISGDDEGNLWAIGMGEQGEVWQWDGKTWATHTVSEGLSGGAYADMQVLADGRVYLAGDRGLDIWDGDSWRTFGALPGRNVKRIWQDSAGDLWASSEITPGRPFNLSLNRRGRWGTVLNEAGSRGMGAEPLALQRDSRGWVWLGTSQGLYTYELDGDSRWRGLGPVQDLSAGPVLALYEDAVGTVWAAVGEQVYRADHVACAQEEACWDWSRFEPGVGPVRQIAAGPDNSVLFAGDEGLVLYHPNPPDLRLEQVVNLITGEAADGQEPVVLTIGRNALRVDLVTLAPTLPDRQISYRYRLEGVDEDWRIAPARSLGGKRPSITYAGLAGGVYTFTAAARTQALDYGPEISFSVVVASRPPELFLARVAVAGRPAEQPGAIRSTIEQPIQIELSSGDDQSEPLTYRYQIEGLSDGWTETTRSEISFTLSAAGTYTFVAMALDGEGQASALVGSQIIVSEGGKADDSMQLPVETVAAGMGALAVLFIGTAVILILRRRRRESW